MEVTQLFENDFKVIIPEIFLVLVVSMLLVYGSVVATREINFFGGLSNPVILSPMLMLTTQTLFIGAILAFNNIFPKGSLLYGTLYHDGLTTNGKALIFLFGGLVLVSSESYLKSQKIHAFEYGLLILLASMGLGLLISSYDLISLYLALELQSLSLYVLAAFKRGSAFSTEAGLKYLIVGAFSSGLLLFGSSLIYGYTGTTNFEDLNRLSQGGLLEESPLFVGGLVLLMTGLLFKLAAAPFHMWAPDIYEGSPTSSSLFFASVPKLAIIGLLVRVFYGTFHESFTLWQSFFMVSAMASMIVGALGALYQRRIKRFLAFSSISHVGYILLGLSGGSLESLTGVLLYMVIYMVISLNIWTVVLTTTSSSPSRTVQGSIAPKYIDELSTVSKVNPVLAFTIALTMFSMAGIPPLAGFWSKAFVFLSAMGSSLYLLAIIGVLTSVIGAFYYLRWVKIIFFDGGSFLPANDKMGYSKAFKYHFTVDRGQSLVLGLSSLFILFFMVKPTPFILLTHQMALGFCF